jgi:hypothetical protein
MTAGAKRLVVAVVALGGAAAAWILFQYDPAQVPIYPVCHFHRLTGWECPSCGSLRALHELLHGHWRSAVRLNLFLVASLPLLAALSLRFAREKMQGKPAVFIRPFWLWLYLAAGLAFGVLRNLPFPQLAFLRP